MREILCFTENEMTEIFLRAASSVSAATGASRVLGAAAVGYVGKVLACGGPTVTNVSSQVVSTVSDLDLLADQSKGSLAGIIETLAEAESRLFRLGFSGSYSAATANRDLEELACGAAYLRMGEFGGEVELVWELAGVKSRKEAFELGWDQTMFTTLGGNIRHAIRVVCGVRDMFHLAAGLVNKVNDMEAASRSYDSFLARSTGAKGFDQERSLFVGIMSSGPYGSFKM
jgi:hypothetical protein